MRWRSAKWYKVVAINQIEWFSVYMRVLLFLAATFRWHKRPKSLDLNFVSVSRLHLIFFMWNCILFTFSILNDKWHAVRISFPGHFLHFTPIHLHFCELNWTLMRAQIKRIVIIFFCFCFRALTKKRFCPSKQCINGWKTLKWNLSLCCHTIKLPKSSSLLWSFISRLSSFSSCEYIRVEFFLCHKR